MASSTMLASIFGPMLIITSLWALLYKENVKKIVDSMKKTPGLQYFVGVINVLLGIVIITSFNYWHMHIELLVTLLGWFFLIRGLILMFFPKTLDSMMKTYMKSSLLYSLIGIVWGLALTWFAFR